MRRTVLRYATVSVLAAGLCLPQASAFAASPAPAPPPGTVLGHRVHVMPFGAKAAHSALRNAAAPAGAQLTYYGGRVVSHLRTVGVLYGSGSYRGYVTGGVSPNMGTFLTGTANSSYLGWLDGEYNTVSPSPTAGLGRTNQRIGSGSYAGLVTITPAAANNGSTIQDSQVQSELSAQIVAGHLPAPQKDAAGNNNTDYVVYFPAGTSVCTPSGCSMASGGFCAYHGTIANVPGYGEVYYTVMPDFTPAGTGCGTNPVEFNNVTSALSHELVETITDPEVGLATSNAPPLSWYNNTYGEIGDICNAVQGTVVGSDGITYTVQTEYSNALADCVLSNPAVTTAPAITSAASVSLTVGSAGSFTVTASGSPLPSLSESGALPSGVSFVDHGDGTATLAGTPAAGTAGNYALTLTAHNGVGSDATQAFTVDGHRGAGDHQRGVGVVDGGVGGFVHGDASGSPLPSLSESGALPSGVTFVDHGDGTATLAGTPAAGTAGSVRVDADRAQRGGSDATQAFTVDGHRGAGDHQCGEGVVDGGVGGFVHGDVDGSSQAVVVSESGALPSGVSFVDHGDGTADSGWDAGGRDGGHVRVDVDSAQRGRVGCHPGVHLDGHQRPRRSRAPRRCR